ncbi:hypothetical protein FVF58_45885 [Paraburkholderia panacisoli]|uniref:Uncharacterized protein n=1 Tax=Paraburkholderia panacisoli TaxID=2603818 RepID=A0A5B0G3Q6_9BURK|nr:hypothetical protein [Paraburkholderia panacisoli]KAA0998123.1 hypothetical protein FVF58_45885 [Paraburkholderia panacisoli]
MANTTADTFCSDLGIMLRDGPRGAAARRTDYVVAWWDGRQLVFAYLREDNQQLLEEEFELEDLLWDEWAAELTAWFRAPKFERLAEIESWIADSPPRDASAGG